MEAGAKRLLSCGPGLLLTLLLASPLAARPVTPNDEPAALEPGRPLERELSGGESHAYLLRLAARQYARVLVRQRGLDVELKIFGPDGQKISESNFPNSADGPEYISLVARTAGVYRLNVSPLHQKTTGRYEILIEELREAGAQDEQRTSEEKLYRGSYWSQGTVFFKGSVDALRHGVAVAEEQQKNAAGSGDRATEAHTLVYRAMLHATLGETPQAIDFLNQSATLWRALGKSPQEAISLETIGELYRTRDERRKALAYFQAALRLKRADGNRWGEASTLYCLALTHQGLDELPQALAYYQQALEIHRAGKNRRGEATTLSSLGSLYLSMNDPTRALECHTRSLSLARELGNRNGEVRGLLHLAKVYLALGERHRALINYYEALPIARALGERYHEASILERIGTLSLQAGDPKRALAAYRQALPIYRALGEPAYEGAMLNFLSSAHRAQGELRLALEYSHQALSLFQRTKDRLRQAYTLVYRSLTLLALGEKSEALAAAEESRRMACEIGSRKVEPDALDALGQIQLALGEKAQAAASLHRALLLRREQQDLQGEAHTLYLLARASRASGLLDEAQTQIATALRLAESTRAKLVAAEARDLYFASAQQYYEFRTELLMELAARTPTGNFAALALENNERARVRSLLETLTEAGARIREGIDPQLLRRESEAQQEFNAASHRLLTLLAEPHSEEQVSAARQQIEITQARFKQAQAELRAASPRYAALAQPQPLCLAEIQRQVVDEDTLLLEYALGRDRSFLWAVTPQRIFSYELPPRAEIEAVARRFYESLTARSRQIRFEAPDEREARIAQSDAEAQHSAKTLSQMLLAPVAQELQRKRLLIVSDGALQYVPFAALLKPEFGSRKPETGNRKPETGRKRASDSPADSLPAAEFRIPNSEFRPLIADHEIISLPSASTLAVLRRELQGRQPAPKSVAVIADPVFEKNDARFGSLNNLLANASARTRSENDELTNDLFRGFDESDAQGMRLRLQRLPFTRREAAAITALVPADERHAALDFAASRSTVTSGELAQYRYVHFATHGLVNSAHPELSGLVFSLVDEEGRAQDGFLRLHEIFNLRLPAELVVLSACRTGLGKEVRGEGMVGLTRGFMYAGAARVMVSLWDVNDQVTAELMTKLYQGLLGKQHLSPAAALREAQLALWRDKRWQAPYYWAAFTLQGEPR
jgi:CHAT domain-containing protein/tetratricopeptide (TPR) repeat protein